MRRDLDQLDRCEAPRHLPEAAADAETAVAQQQLSALARQPPAVRAAVVGRLSQGAGNRAVVGRMIDMERDIAKQWQQEAGEKIRISLATATDAQKLAEIERLQRDRAVNPPSPFDADTTAWAIGRVWRSFGPRLWEVALANREFFEKQMGPGDEAMFFDAGWDGLRQKFKDAVEGRVRDNLRKNRDYVQGEMRGLGLVDRADAADLRGRAEQDRGLREMQVKADRVGKAQQGMFKARQVPVGQKVEVYGSGPDALSQIETVYFDPETPPSHDWVSSPESKDWATVKKEYDKLDMFVKQAAAESPALFALVEDSGQSAGAFAGLDAEAARDKLRPLLQSVIAKIDEAEGLVGEDLDYREMAPVHEQLMNAPEWSGKIERELIRRTIMLHHHDKLLRSLGLSALSALGFLFATFATGGAAVFIGVAVGVGASGVQAGLSIEDYFDKAKARAARTGNPELDIMSQEAVDSARTQAILDTALAVIDGLAGVGEIAKLASPAVKMARAGEAGMRASAELAVRESLHAGDAATQAAAIERAVAEIGTDGVVKATGKTPAELAKLVPAESETAKRLLAAASAADAGAKEAEGLFAKLGILAGLDNDAAAKAILEGFDRVGYIGTIEAAGGWKAVTKRFGDAHEIVTRLEAWRSQIVQEGLDFIKASSKGESSAVRTGTEKGTSDVDISTFGRDAAQNVERLKEFLARRTSITRDRLEFLLDADAAVNPSRMHLQDIAPNLADATHTEILAQSARHQEHLIFARRWHDAREARDFELMQKLEEIAADVGIGKINKAWEPMDAKALAALEHQLDGWAKELAKLEKAGASETARRPLIEKIGRGQAELLANNPNMYIDAGNIKTLVTRRDIDLRKIESALGSLDQASLARLGTVFTHERYLKILGEGPHIDHAFQSIRLGKGTPTEIATALKAFAKHGERVVQTVGADVAHGVDTLEWAWMDLEFGRILQSAKEGQLISEVGLDLAAFQSRVATAAEQLQKGMTNATRALREQAGLGAAMTSAEAQGITAWARAEATARMQSEALKQSLMQLHDGMLAGRVTGDAINLVLPNPLTLEPPPEPPQTSTPAPAPAQ